MWGLLGTAEPVGLFVGARVQPSGWGFTAADGRGSAGARQGLLAKGLQGSVFTHKEKGVSLTYLRALNAKYCLKDKKRTAEILL